MILTWTRALKLIFDRRSLLTIFFFCYLFAAAQDKEPLLNSSLHLGGNYTTIYLEDDRLDRALRPFVGWLGQRDYGTSFSMNYGANFFSKAAHITASVDLEWKGVEVSASPMFHFGDLALFLGPKLMIPFNYNYRYKGDGLQTLQLPDTIELGVFTAQVGAQLKLQDDVYLLLSHNLAFDQEVEQSFQIGLRIPLGSGKNQERMSLQKRQNISSVKQIKGLKEGALLVRLSKAEPKINAMKKMGLEEKAEKVEERQQALNRSLLTAFKKHYNFSKVYFFYSENSNRIRKKDFRGILLNDSLQEDPSIQLDPSLPLFTVELKFRDADSLRYFIEYEDEIVGSFEQIRSPIYGGGSNLSFYGLFISDDQFRQLCRPFPYYSRYIGSHYRGRPDRWILMSPLLATFSALSIDKAVKRLDNKLNRFYLKQSITSPK